MLNYKTGVIKDGMSDEEIYEILCNNIACIDMRSGVIEKPVEYIWMSRKIKKNKVRDISNIRFEI